MGACAAGTLGGALTGAGTLGAAGLGLGSFVPVVGNVTLGSIFTIVGGIGGGLTGAGLSC